MPEWPVGLSPERRDRKNRIGTRIEIDGAQSATVRRIFGEYAAGAGFRDIAHRLNADGIPSSRGKPSWDMGAVRTMLLNRRYIGDWSWNRRRWQKTPEALLSEGERERVRLTGRLPRRPTLRPVDDLIEHRDETLRIIPDELWAAVQARFAARSRVRRGGEGYRRTRSPVAGLFTCSCGGKLAIAASTRKGHRYVRIGCARHRNRGPKVCGNSIKMRIETVAEPLLAFLRRELSDPARIAAAVELVNRKVGELSRNASSAAKADALASEVARIEREVENLVDAVEKAPASAALLARLTERERELEQAKARLELARPTAPPASPPQVSAEAIVARLGKLWEDIQKLDGDRARLALERIFEGLTVKPLDGDWEGLDPGATTTPLGRDHEPRGEVASKVGCGGGI